jgi:hypothetical protein
MRRSSRRTPGRLRRCWPANDKFKTILDHFAAGQCITCRKGAPCFEFCAARTCHKEKGVDFCFQCAEFPCDRTATPASLGQTLAGIRRPDEGNRRGTIL